MIHDDRLLWRLEPAGFECVMISCCAGAELQLRRRGEIVARELYPDKPTLYERARTLRTELVELDEGSTDRSPASRP